MSALTHPSERGCYISAATLLQFPASGQMGPASSRHSMPVFDGQRARGGGSAATSEIAHRRRYRNGLISGPSRTEQCPHYFMIDLPSMRISAVGRRHARKPQNTQAYMFQPSSAVQAPKHWCAGAGGYFSRAVYWPPQAACPVTSRGIWRVSGLPHGGSSRCRMVASQPIASSATLNSFRTLEVRCAALYLVEIRFAFVSLSRSKRGSICIGNIRRVYQDE